MIKAGSSVEVCGKWRDAIVELPHTCRIKKVDRIKLHIKAGHS